MSKIVNPATKLRSALLTLAEGKATITCHGERSWASITFRGTRHQVTLTFSGPDKMEAGARFVDLLPQHDFVIAGQLVADAVVSAVDHQMVPEERMIVQVEVLMLDDGQ